MSNNEYFIIGDIAGRYDTFVKLVEQAPKSATIVSIGDMVDRGKKSKDVVEFFASGKGIGVLGNHCHMMLEAINTYGTGRYGYYRDGVWENNGGLTTVASYLGMDDWREAFEWDDFVAAVPEHHLAYLKGLPTFLKFDGLIITHAPINPSVPFESLSNFGTHALSREGDRSLIWNRGTPRRMEGVFQVYGHNSYRDTHWHEDENGKWGVCIDTCRGGKLTAIHFPSLDIYQQDFVEA